MGRFCLEEGRKRSIERRSVVMALPLTGGGCYPNHNANTPVYNDLCSDWNAVEVKAHKEESNVIVTVTGSYKEFEGS